MLDLETTSVTFLKLERWEGVKSAVAVKAERVPQVGASGVGRPTFVVGEGDFFAHIDVADRVNSFVLCVGVLVIVGVWKAGSRQCRIRQRIRKIDKRASNILSCTSN